ncbi:hypothetical protein K2173_001342 [Erythroxylum novogranatense]|uniref:starch synthase n=1 Tax=Erythroxylum novogranatense TaxID=1862640 RepID=A0AAV8T3G7_9ROSI|nr:hypothetical protein K2173_001342 [Erythroxylum novogranatense]
MAAKLSNWFLSHSGFMGLDRNKQRTSLRFPLPTQRLRPASCRMRPRHFRSENKRRPVKEGSPEQPSTSADFECNDEEGPGRHIVLADSVPNSNHDIAPKHIAPSIDVNNIQNTNRRSLDSCVDMEHVWKTDATSLDSLANEEMKPLALHKQAEEKLSDDLDETESLAVNMDHKERLPGVQHDDMIAMIRNAEKNILLLNQARIRALEDLERILNEKEGLQGEINVLQMRLAETDAKLKVAAQQKVHVELLEDQLEKLRDELTHSAAVERSLVDPFEDQSKFLTEKALLVQNTVTPPLSEELRSLRMENMSLKNDIEKLKLEQSNIKDTDERIIVLEKEKSFLESLLKDLEDKLSASREDLSKISSLKIECKDLQEKVEGLQVLLDNATKQADHAVLVLQKNQELQKKVDKLEECMEEANVYKASSERLHQYNELMQEKIKLLEERIQRSDEEIHSYIQLYQDSVEEFQETLNSLKKESKKRALNEPIDDMPSEFWSHILLIIDGWMLEKRISTDDAKLLREMVWKKDAHIRDAYLECREKNQHEAITRFMKLTSSPRSPGLHVIHIAAEMAPVAKVGGLGDVVTGLGKALQKRGHLVEIILPKYDCMQYERIKDLRALNVVVESYFDGKLYKNKIWVGTVEGLPIYFIEPHHPDKFFWRGQFYGQHDDFRRFSFFSRAALELLLQAGKRPDIIHCHDWQTAFIAPLYWDIYAPKGLNSARICFTCHNFEYQGTAPASELASCGLDVHQLNRSDRMQDNSAHDRVNPIKGAVVFSNIVTTVSPTYAQEVRTAEGGKGLHSTLNFHSKKFIGILNGIDTDAWNPATDSFLKVQYSSNDLQGKEENKMVTRRNLRLSTSDVRQPLVGCITRLVPQKGVHLIRHAIYRTLELGGQFVLLGSSPIEHIQREFEGIANHFQNHDQIRLILKFDECLSRRIYAASDMFIIPSIFEPCGLTQMIAMKYGSIPIARKTGGLNDSVFDIDDDTIPLHFRNGFTFLNPDEQGMNIALERAFNYYRNNPGVWKELVQKDMSIDFSWESSASQYEELYAKSVARARASALANRGWS